MLARLGHRGPDGEGVFADDAGVALCHARLAIIDLSDGGRQPFASEDGSRQLLHNGEIFNYVELRRSSRRTATGSGRTPTRRSCCTPIDALGRRLRPPVQRHVGDHTVGLPPPAALVLARSVRHQAVRVSLGRHTLRVRERAAGVAGGSAGDRRSRTSTRFATSSSRATSTTATGRSSRASSSSHPAHSLVVDETGLRVTRWWSLEPADVDGDAAATFRDLFVDAVRLRLRSDVPLGTALSGGLDSSAVAVTIDHLLHTEAESARQVGQRQQTFTVWFDEPHHDERRYADAVARQIASEPHYLTFDDEEAVRLLPAVVAAQGEPFGSTSIVAQWVVMRAAAQPGTEGDARRPGRRRDAGRVRVDHALLPVRRPRLVRSARHARPRAAIELRGSLRVARRHSSPPRFRNASAGGRGRAATAETWSSTPACEGGPAAGAAARIRGTARPAAPPVPRHPRPARLARAPPVRGPQLDGPLARGPGPVPGSPPGSARATGCPRISCIATARRSAFSETHSQICCRRRCGRAATSSGS